MKRIIMIILVVLLIGCEKGIEKTGQAVEGTLTPPPSESPTPSVTDDPEIIEEEDHCATDEIPCDFDDDGLESGDCCRDDQTCEWNSYGTKRQCVNAGGVVATPSQSPSQESSATASASVELCEWNMYKIGNPDRITKEDSTGTKVVVKTCSVSENNFKPYCGLSNTQTREKDCFECTINDHCGRKCTPLQVCEGGACSPCDYITFGKCIMQTDSNGEITRTCSYEIQHDEDGKHNMAACFVGKCEPAVLAHTPADYCLIKEEDCGRTCVGHTIYDLKVNAQGTGCETDYGARLEFCGTEPCTTKMTAGGTQEAYCGCDGIEDISLGTDDEGQFIPSNYLCISGETFSRFIDQSTLDNMLFEVKNICDQCGLENINLNFMGHGAPGIQGFSFPDQPSEDEKALDLEYCNSLEGSARLGQLGDCVEKVVLNGCEVGQGTEGQALRQCLSDKMRIPIENVEASEENNQIDPQTGRICPISDFASETENSEVFNSLEAESFYEQFDLIKNWILS